MRKILRTSKLDEAVGRVQFGRPRNFFNRIISKLDEHVVLLPIHYIASVLLSYLCIKAAKNVVKLVFGNLLKLSHFASLNTPQVKHRLIQAFLLLWAFLFWLFSLISSKSVASIFGNLAEDSIWKSESSNRLGEKWGNSNHNKTKRATIARWRLKAVIITATWLASTRFFYLS